MKKDTNGGVIAFAAAALMPLIPLSYLFSRNALYLSAAQFLLIGLAMVIVSALAFLVFRAIARSGLAALAGCLGMWVLFFAWRSFYVMMDNRGFSIVKAGLIYAAVFLAVTVLLLVLLRNRQAPDLCKMAGLLVLVLLVINIFPLAKSLTQGGEIDLSPIRTEFEISEDKPAPNIYWIHTDGMLGFSAFERYFGDGQEEFKRQLEERGFRINEDAALEANHTTKIAVACLMCPDYYDQVLSPLLTDHESANAAVLRDPSFSEQLQTARLRNETRCAFEAKGYSTQTIGSINIYYPPVTDRQYMTGGTSRSCYFEPDEAFKSRYKEVIQGGEAAILLTGIHSTSYFNAMVRLSEKGLLPFKLQRKYLAAGESDIIGSVPRVTDRRILESLDDASRHEGSNFTILFDITAHHPFTVDEEGAPTGGDPDEITNYGPQHRYAAKFLIHAIDLILENDPDAVIVLQADHGLHGQSAEQITKAFGEDAVTPIWNQVMSAVRVPEQFATEALDRAVENPLNISRYLVNTFVGENYPYLPAA